MPLRTEWLLTEALRDEWGFDCLVVSDGGAVATTRVLTMVASAAGALADPGSFDPDAHHELARRSRPARSCC